MDSAPIAGHAAVLAIEIVGYGRMNGARQRHCLGAVKDAVLEAGAAISRDLNRRWITTPRGGWLIATMTAAQAMQIAGKLAHMMRLRNAHAREDARISLICALACGELREDPDPAGPSFVGDPMTECDAMLAQPCACLPGQVVCSRDFRRALIGFGDYGEEIFEPLGDIEMRDGPRAIWNVNASPPLGLPRLQVDEVILQEAAPDARYGFDMDSFERRYLKAELARFDIDAAQAAAGEGLPLMFGGSLGQRERVGFAITQFDIELVDPGWTEDLRGLWTEDEPTRGGATRLGFRGDRDTPRWIIRAAPGETLMDRRIAIEDPPLCRFPEPAEDEVVLLRASFFACHTEGVLDGTDVPADIARQRVLERLRIAEFAEPDGDGVIVLGEVSARIAVIASGENDR